MEEYRKAFHILMHQMTTNQMPSRIRQVPPFDGFICSELPRAIDIRPCHICSWLLYLRWPPLLRVQNRSTSQIHPNQQVRFPVLNYSIISVFLNLTLGIIYYFDVDAQGQGKHWMRKIWLHPPSAYQFERGRNRVLLRDSIPTRKRV